MHQHDQAHGMQVPGRDRHTIALETALLGKNQALAERNRGWLAGRGVLALNLMSSPGAGKTTLLERCIRDLQGQAMIDNARQVNPGLKIFPVSTYSGEGLDAWFGWLHEQMAATAAA